MAGVDLTRFVEKFKDDSHLLLNELEGKLLELEKDSSNHELIEAVFRVMHTLKGVGGMFGYDAISNYTHYLEGIYDKIRNKTLVLSHDIFNVTFDSVDHLRNLLGDQNVQNLQLASRHKELIEKIEKVLKNSNLDVAKPMSEKAIEIIKQSKTEATWFIYFKCSEELIFRGVNIVYLFEDIAKLGKFYVEKLNTIQTIDSSFEETWGIYVFTEAPYEEIEDIFMFVSEYVKILKASTIDLLNPQSETDLSVTTPTAGNSIFELALKQGEIANHKGNNVTEINTAEVAINDKPALQSNVISRISVGSDKLDKLMYLVSELFTTKSELLMATDAQNWERVKAAAEKVDKLSNLFRNNALNIRLVPLKDVTQKFKRLIRDLSQTLNKKIDFDAYGDETELDKNLVDSLTDPFMHIIRNCIDHGIENSDVRVANGKSDTGTIKFVASQTGNFINIQISDDGKGINTDYIRSKAIEKGFIQHNAQLTKTELLDLIFLPGFSTAETLSQVSGRGVGMDVVKRAITSLRGSIQIDTETNRGTTFSIKLQQTISIIDTLLIKTGETYFTIHLEEIELCGLETHNHLFDRVNSHWQLNDELIPFVYLRSTFKIKGQSPEMERIVVVRKNSKRIAIVTDEIIGQHQAVLKPIGDLVKKQECISGASIIGDGHIALMLDTEKLMQSNKFVVNEYV